MSTTKLRRRLHIVCSIDRSIYGSAFSATTKIKDLKKTKKERQPMRLRMRMTTMMMRIMMRMVNGSSRWPFSTAFKDCTLMAPRTLFLPLSLSRSNMHLLFPHSQSHPTLSLFWHCFCDCLLRCDNRFIKKAKYALQKKKKQKTGRKISKAKYRHTHTHRRLFGSKKCGKFGNAHWCALRCEIVTIVLAIVAQATAHCLVANSRKGAKESKYSRAVPSLALTALKGHVNGMNASPCISRFQAAMQYSMQLQHCATVPLLCLPHPHTTGQTLAKSGCLLGFAMIFTPHSACLLSQRSNRDTNVSVGCTCAAFGAKLPNI